MQPETIDVAKQETQAAAEGYLHRVAVAFDVFMNVVLRGRQGETLSARAYRASLENKAWGKVLNGALSLIQKDHGAKACAGDLERAMSIAATEEKILK